MTGPRPAEILRQLEQSGEPDSELLARFATAKDSNAFAELVRRHASLVFGVCRRVTGHPQDAEDAFQATFLVLAKKAGAIRNAALLGNWLYGVAFRVAWKAKRSTARRRTREVSVATPPDVPAPVPLLAMTELAPVLDEELAALASVYRDAIVMCDLRGLSRAEAATALGIPEGTLSSRLANGRKKLAARLTRRGIALSVGALPAALSEATASGAVPNELISRTCGLVADFVAGGSVPRPLVRLAEGGSTMRKSLMLVVALAFGVGGAVFAARSSEDAPPVDPPKPPREVAEKLDAVAQPKDEVKEEAPAPKEIPYTRAPKLRQAQDISLTDITSIEWSPDGKFLALEGEVTKAASKSKELRVISLEKDVGQSRSRPLGSNQWLVGFTPDSREVVVEKREYHLISGIHQRAYLASPDPGLNFGVDPRVVDLDLPVTHGSAYSPDGKSYRTVTLHFDGTDISKALEVLEVDAKTGKVNKSLLKVDHVQNSYSNFNRYALAPNGKRLATLDKDTEKVTVYDLDRGAKQFEYALGGGKLSELPLLAPRGVGRGNPGGSWGVETSPQNSPRMVFSYDARRLVVSRAIGQTVVLNAETGEAMPELEGSKEARLHANAYPFSGDGRLLAMSGSNYKLVKQRLDNRKNAPEQAMWVGISSFLTVWDTQTGKVLKSWDRDRSVAFCPSKPLLVILEPNGEKWTRVGFWDFAPEVEKK